MASLMDTMCPTTYDNPFDPFTQWDRWRSYDVSCRHFSLEHLAVYMRPSVELSEAEQEDAFLNALLSLLTYCDPYNNRTIAVKGKTRRFGIPLSKSNNKEEPKEE